MPHVLFIDIGPDDHRDEIVRAYFVGMLFRFPEITRDPRLAKRFSSAEKARAYAQSHYLDHMRPEKLRPQRDAGEAGAARDAPDDAGAS